MATNNPLDRLKPITLADKPILQPFLNANRMEESHLAFANLYMWQKSYHISYAIIDDVLYLSLRFCESRPMFFEPLPLQPQADIRPMIDTVLSFYEEYPQEMTLRSVSVRFRNKMEQVYGDRYEYVADRRNYDYIYPVRDLIELKGSKYHGKRNHINKFVSQYSYEYAPYSAAYRDACCDLYQRWYVQREGEGMENPEADESEAMRRALDDAQALGFSGGVILVNGQVEAFTLGERLTDNMALIHVEKANSEIQGLYPLINQQYLLNQWSDMEFVNREEDMGIPGLRKAKLSYHPVRLLEKYIVVPRLKSSKTR